MDNQTELDWPVALTAVGNFLVEGTRTMFYLRSPQELALDSKDSAPDYLIKYGVPMFFIMIVVEWIGLAIRSYFSGHHNTNSHGGLRPFKFYRLNDMLVSTTLGTVQILIQVLTEYLGLLATGRIYNYVFDNYRFTELPVKEWPIVAFIAVMLLKDVGYYWQHRSLHEFHILWVGHSVHHSGEDYNLATGLRQGILQQFTGWLFYWPLALAGIPPATFMAHSQLNTLYQYWIHTDLVNRMPLGLEYVLNGPMAHRMHHRFPGNRNYAAVFIIWDRMFGTYEAEKVRMDAYGLAKQPNTFSIMRLNTNHLKAMSHIGSGDKWKSTWAYRLISRRIKRRWVFSPSALWKPIEELRADRRISAGSVRKKWEGHRSSGIFVNLCFAATSIAGLLFGLLVIMRKKSMESTQVIFGLIGAVIMLEIATQIADRSPKMIYITLLHRAVSLTSLLILAAVVLGSILVMKIMPSEGM